MATKSIGRGMVIAAWIGFLVLVTWLFQGILSSHNNPNETPLTQYAETGQVEVVLHRNRSGHYVTAGRINGHAVEMLVDTGATEVALSDRMATRLGIRPGAAVALKTANGTVRGYTARIDSISVGGIQMRNIGAVISPGIDDNSILLGMSFLKHLELVQKDRILTLRTPG